MQLLVTGGAGFIGSNFIHFMLENSPHHIINIDKLTYAGSRRNLGRAMDHPRHHFILGDIRDRDLLDSVLDSVDCVVNFAAESHVDRSIESSDPFVETNIVGVKTLLDAFLDHDVSRFVQISTDEVYGQISDGTFSEDDRLNPRNPYAATKASAELLIRSYVETYGIPAVIARPSNNYGPRQHPEKLVPKFIERTLDGKPLPVHGDGQHVREWTYVDDCCRAIEILIDRGEPGCRYNIGSGEELTTLEVTHEILNQLDASESRIAFVQDRPANDRRYALDSSRIRSLGWEPVTDFTQGLERTIEYHSNSLMKMNPVGN